jgi:hypothetical protein
MSIPTSASSCGSAPPNPTAASWLPTSTCALMRRACRATATRPWRKRSLSSAARSEPGLPTKANGFLDPARPCEFHRTRSTVGTREYLTRGPSEIVEPEPLPVALPA